MRRGESNIFDFYEKPQRVAHTEKDNTADGYDFTIDDYVEPQAVENETAENIEININNTNMIYKSGGEKQVSPTPLNEEFCF